MASAADTLTTGQGRRLAIARMLWAAPLIVAAAYLVTLATQFSRLIASTYLNADVASAPVIGQMFGGDPAHRQVILGHLGWFSTLLFELGTRWMPLHREIWEGAPYAMALGAAALVGWGAWCVAGRWAAAVAVAAMVCAGPSTLPLLLALNDHAPTWFTLALLGAFVIGLVQKADVLPTAALVATVLVVGVVLGANAASDVLLIVAGAVPFLLAVGCVWFLHPSRASARAAVLALVTCLVALVGGVLVHAYMHHENVLTATDANTKLLAGAEVVGTNVKLWWQSLAVLGNGNFFGEEIGVSSALAVACAALTLAAVLLVVRAGWRELGRGLAARRSRSYTREQSVRLAWWVYWVSSLVLLSAAFILSGLPENLESSRYLVGAIYAVAALVPMLAGRAIMARAAVTLAVTLYAFTGWLGLAQERVIASQPTSPSYAFAGAIEAIASREHVSVGYAGYWDAAPLTWATHLRLHVFPVDDCDGNQHLCGYELHLITSWYTPRPATRTFLLSDTAYPGEPSAPTPDLGKPIAVHQIGSITMYVYGYDIATHLFAL